MAGKAKTNEKAPQSCEQCKRWKEIKSKLRISKLLADAIKGVETKLQSPDYKPTVADYLKLIQMEQEIENESAKEIRVTWVEPTTVSSPDK
ncbi:MAG TPA: hypothetical protein VGF59_35745 [Bryobacteraceae bacterium]|jgi:hypothetical protein